MWGMSTVNNIKISRIQRKSAEDVLEWLLRYGKDWVNYVDLYEDKFAEDVEDKKLGLSAIMAISMGLYGGKVADLEKHGYVEEEQRQNAKNWMIDRRFKLTDKALALLEKYNKYNELKGKEHGRRK